MKIGLEVEESVLQYDGVLRLLNICAALQGCTKKSRGSSGLCRSHGGGEKCVVANCQGFAR